MAPSALVCSGTEGCPRPREGAIGGRPHRHRTPRDKLHHTGGPRRHTRRDIFHRDLRCDHGACLHANVSVGTCHKVDGHKDGAVGRRCRRDIWRIPLLPQGAHTTRLSRRDRAQALQTISVRLPACQQKSGGMGRRGPCAVPRQGVPRRGDAHQSCRQDVSWQDCGEAHRARSLCRHVAPGGGMATERAVQRRRGLLVDRHAEAHNSRPSERRTDGACRRALPHQPAAQQRRILLPFHLRRTFPQRLGGTVGAQCAQRGV